MAIFIELEKILEIERGLAEEMIAALGAKLEQAALDRADRGLGDIAIFERQFVGALAAMDHHRLEVVEVEQHQPFLVGDMKGDVDHAFLNLVEVEQPGQQQRPHFADRSADRMTLSPEQVPELHRAGAVAPVGHADVGGARLEDLVRPGRAVAGHRQSGEVALHVGDEGRDADRRQSLDNALQGDGLAGAGGARDQPVAIGALQLERLRIGPAAARPDVDIGRLIAHVSVPRPARR